VVIFDREEHKRDNFFQDHLTFSNDIQDFVCVCVCVCLPLSVVVPFRSSKKHQRVKMVISHSRHLHVLHTISLQLIAIVLLQIWIALFSIYKTICSFCPLSFCSSLSLSHVFHSKWFVFVPLFLNICLCVLCQKKRYKSCHWGGTF